MLSRGRFSAGDALIREHELSSLNIGAVEKRPVRGADPILRLAIIERVGA